MLHTLARFVLRIVLSVRTIMQQAQLLAQHANQILGSVDMSQGLALKSAAIWLHKYLPVMMNSADSTMAAMTIAVLCPASSATSLIMYQFAPMPALSVCKL